MHKLKNVEIYERKDQYKYDISKRVKCNKQSRFNLITLWKRYLTFCSLILRVTLFLDMLTAVKLHFAFLQYPVIEFYSLSRSRSDRNRDSLIALAWLLETQNVLTIVLRTKLASGILGAECSRVDPPEVRSREENFSYMNLFINIYRLYILF